MKYITKLKLAAINQICDAEDKSTEFMIQLMQDACGVDHGCVMNYLINVSDKEKEQLYEDVLSFTETFYKIEQIVPFLMI